MEKNTISHVVQIPKEHNNSIAQDDNLIDSSKELKISNLKFDSNFSNNVNSFLKIVQAFFCILGLVCVSLSRFTGPYLFFLVSSIIGLIMSTAWIIIYMFHLKEMKSRIELYWLKGEFLTANICFMLFIYYSIHHIAFSSYTTVDIQAAIVGLINVAAYGYDAYLCLQELRRTNQGFVWFCLF